MEKPVPPHPDMQDTLITIVIMLFVLSLIAERIASLIKLHFSTTRVKKKSAEDESIRERKIIWISLLSGFLTAAALKADLILILRTAFSGNDTDLASLLGWTCNAFDSIGPDGKAGFDGWVVFRTSFGITFSAIFLSFGSKFWHDTIDILLEVKNTKKTINSLREQYGVSGMDSEEVAKQVDKPAPINLVGAPSKFSKDIAGKYSIITLNFTTYPLNEDLQISISGDPEGKLTGAGQKFTYEPVDPQKVVVITAKVISNPQVKRVFFIYV